MQTDMASPGLWGNVTLNKVYLPLMAPLYVQKTLVPKQEEIGSPRGRAILTNVKGVCAPICALEAGPLWNGSRMLPKMEGRGVL